MLWRFAIFSFYPLATFSSNFMHKVIKILSHLPGSFQYFQFLWKGLNIKLQLFVTIFCWNIYHQTCRCLFCLFTFWKQKKCNPVFNPWLSLLFNPLSYLHREYIYIIRTQLTPCAKFHASSCCQTNIKVEGQFCPPPSSLRWTNYNNKINWNKIRTGKKQC